MRAVPADERGSRRTQAGEAFGWGIRRGGGGWGELQHASVSLLKHRRRAPRRCYRRDAYLLLCHRREGRRTNDRNPIGAATARVPLPRINSGKTLLALTNDVVYSRVLGHNLFYQDNKATQRDANRLLQSQNDLGLGIL